MFEIERTESNEERAMKDEIFKYVSEAYMSGTESVRPVPLKLIVAIFTRRSQSRLNRSVMNLIESDKRLYLHWTPAMRRFVIPKSAIEEWVDVDAPKDLQVKQRTDAKARLFEGLDDRETQAASDRALIRKANKDKRKDEKFKL